MLSEIIFESLANVGELVRCVKEPGFAKIHKARVLKLYADLLRLQWELDTLPGSEAALAHRVADMSDLELIERRAALLRSMPAELQSPRLTPCAARKRMAQVRAKEAAHRTRFVRGSRLVPVRSMRPRRLRPTSY